MIAPGMDERGRFGRLRLTVPLLVVVALAACRSDGDDDVWGPRTRLTAEERASRAATADPAPRTASPDDSRSDTATIVLRPDPSPAADPVTAPTPEPTPEPAPEPVPVPRPRLVIVASGTAEAIASEPVDYTFTVRNTGDGPARDVVLRVDLGGDIETLGGSREPTFVADSIAPTSWRTFRVRGTAPAGRHTVRAVATCGGRDPVHADPIVTVVTRIALALEHSGPERPAFETDVTATIEIANDGGHAARGVEVAVALPAGIDCREASAPGVLEGRTVVWPIGALAAGERRRLTYRVGTGRVPRPTLVATATARGARVTAPLAWQARAVPLLALEVVDLEDPVAVDGSVTWVVTVSNRGTAPDHDVAVSCVVSAGVEIESVRGPGTADRDGGRVGFATVPTLEPGERVSWAIVARPGASGEASITTRATSRGRGTAVVVTESTRFGP